MGDESPVKDDERAFALGCVVSRRFLLKGLNIVMRIRLLSLLSKIEVKFCTMDREATLPVRAVSYQSIAIAV